VLLPAA